MRLKFSESDLLGAGWINEPLQFVARVNIRHETFWDLGNCLGQRYMVDKATAGRVSVETAERVVLAPPVTIHRTGSGQESLHLFRSDLACLYLRSHTSAKCVQQTLCTIKLRPHRLPERCVL